MERTTKKKRKPMKKYIIILAVVLLIGAASSAILLIFRVNQIEYTGSSHYNSEQLGSYLFDGNSPNSLIYNFFGRNKEISIPFVQKIDVEIGWPDKMYITVYEKPMIGYVNYMGCNMYFDKDGIVVESSTEELEDIPQITGLNFKSIVLNSKLEVSNRNVFHTILELTQGFDKYELIVDRIHFDTESNVTLYMGDVKILMGKSDDLTDKLYELKQISEKLTGLKGTLHLENYTTDSKSVIFKKSSE